MFAKMDPETKNLYTSKNTHFVLEMLKPIELSRRSVSAKGMLQLLNRTSPKVLQHSFNNMINAYFAFPSHDRMAKQLFFSGLSFVNLWL